MKTYDEISKRVLERRDEYITEQKGKRKKITQITSAIGCFVLVVGIGFGMNMDKWVQTQVIDPYDLGGAVFPTATLTINQGNSTEILTTTSPETTLPAIDSSENWTTVPTTTPSENLTTTSAPDQTGFLTTVPPELYHEIDWSYRSTPGKFSSVLLDSGKYGDVTIKSNNYSDFNEYVYPFNKQEEHPTTRKGVEFISDMPIEVFDNNGKSYRTTIDIFTLEGISENLAIGVRFPDDIIYTYINIWYIPETLGEFLDAIDYDNTVTYGGITLYPGNNFPVNDENIKDIKDYLLSDSESKNLGDLTVSDNCVTASIYCRELGIENKSFRISEDGYITTNIIGYQYVFYVGKEKAADFLKNSYNITFEQIKEMRSNTTTAPLITEAETTVSENAVVEVTTSRWCGIGM
jgi:hypothetical protein